VKRRKRLEKGIKSLKEQIKVHEEKRKKVSAEGMIERMTYYEKEIKGLKDRIKNRKKKIV